MVATRKRPLGGATGGYGFSLWHPGNVWVGGVTVVSSDPGGANQSQAITTVPGSTSHTSVGRGAGDFVLSRWHPVLVTYCRHSRIVVTVNRFGEPSPGRARMGVDPADRVAGRSLPVRQQLGLNEAVVRSHLSRPIPS